MASPMWQVPQAVIKRRRDAAFVEIFKFALYASFPLFCMFYFGGPSFYNNHVKPHVTRHVRGVFADSPEVQLKLPADREELQVLMEEMRQKRRDRILEEFAAERGETSKPAAIAAQLPPFDKMRDSERLV